MSPKRPLTPPPSRPQLPSRPSAPALSRPPLPTWLLFALLVVGVRAMGDNTPPTFTEDWAEAEAVTETTRLMTEVEEPEVGDECEICSVVELPEDVGAQEPRLKVTCHQHLLITDLGDIPPRCIPPNTRHLDLSSSGLTRIAAGALPHLPILEKLDLKKNDISVIEPGAFANLTELRKLDLANNAITSLNGSQLAGLRKLTRVKLSRNPLARLHEGLLDQLESAKPQLDLGQTELVCDCGLRWLAEAVVDKKVKVGQSPKCFRPRMHNGTQFKKLKPDEFLCHGPGMSVVELEPNMDQVVFAGDSLRLRCRVTSAEGEHRVWWALGDTHFHTPHLGAIDTVDGYLEQHHQHQQRQGATFKSTYLPDAIESMVEIRELNNTHSGEWSCLVQGEKGNHTRTVSIYVIAHDTKYCPTNVTNNNRGSYVWPRTVAGVTVELNCAGIEPPHQRAALISPAVPVPRLAKHTCGISGQWQYLDTMDCPFVSKTTKILEQFASTNISASKTTLVESIRSLQDFTKDRKIMRDAMDIVFLAQTVDQYTNLQAVLSGAKETAIGLIDVISSSMSAAKELLITAEVLDGSCQRLLECLWRVATSTPTLTRAATPQLEMHQFTRQPETFSGLTCNWYRRSLHKTERYFRCNTNNYSKLYSNDDEILDAQIQVPGSLFPKLSPRISNSSDPLGSTALLAKSVQLQFFVYDTANLFPRVGVGDSNTWEVTSPVIGARIGNQDEDILVKDGVDITLRSAIYSHNIMPVWWKKNGNGSSKHGNWTSDGCKVIRMHNSLIGFRCDRLAHFGLLQDMAALHRNQAGARGAEFRLSAPGVYVGSAICILFLMASIVTWAAHHHRIATMNKNKHSLMNTWIALLLLVTLFTVGVYQTENQQLCQGIGVALHYLTTCVLLWIIVTVTNLYNKVTKALRPPVPVEEPPPDIPLPPKPMLRFYLVGWGIALIVCGISAAVNLQQYAGYSYCFLDWGPSLGAFYAPTAALAFLLSTFFLLTHCMLRSLRASYPEGQGATETTELELLDANSPNSENVNGPGEEEMSIASHDTTVSVSDGQHSPLTQLRAHVVTLLLFILTWAAAAITTAAPFASVIPHHTTIFSIIYAICASSLGIFIFVFFCVSRNDVWEAWREYNCIFTSQQKEEEEEAHLTTPPNNSAANNVMHSNNQPRPGTAPSTHSLESSHTHQTNKSSSVSHSILTSNKPESLNKATNNLQLLSFGTMTNDLHYAPEIFYNPKQAGVAKRFFQKQRLKQMVKQNNLEINRTDSDCNSTVYKPKITRTVNSDSSTGKSGFDPACLGTSRSKVNNTNIHVDSMYGYIPAEFQKGGGKHANKDPTPEVLCVLGPSNTNMKVAEMYPVMTRERSVDIDRGWSTIPRKPRAFMEEPLSPIRRGGSFPSIVEEGHLTSQTTSQSSALEQLQFIPQEQIDQQRMFNYPIIAQVPPINQQLVQYHNPRHHQPHNTENQSRKNRNSFNSDVTERSDATGVSRGTDHSRMSRHHKHRSGRERPRVSKQRRKPPKPRGTCGMEEKDDWTEDNTSPIIINHLPSGEHGLQSSESEKDGGPQQFLSYPQHVHAISPPNTQRAIIQPAIDAINPINPINTINTINPMLPAEQPGDMLCVDMAWPHVMNSGMGGAKHGRPQPEKPNSRTYSPNLEDVGMCCGVVHGDGRDCTAWDSECGEVYWCDGGGEERVSACEVSGCENSSMCGGACGVHEDLCGSQSSDGGTSVGGASVDPAVGTSPRGSVNISDSPYDSPLHRLHQNTPDSGSLDSGLLGSPGRAPPYEQQLSNTARLHSSPKVLLNLSANHHLPQYDCEYVSNERGRNASSNAENYSENSNSDLRASPDPKNSESCKQGTYEEPEELYTPEVKDSCKSEINAADSSGNSIFYLTTSSVETILRNGEVDDVTDREEYRFNEKPDGSEENRDEERAVDELAESNPKRETCV